MPDPQDDDFRSLPAFEQAAEDTLQKFRTFAERFKVICEVSVEDGQEHLKEYIQKTYNPKTSESYLIALTRVSQQIAKDEGMNFKGGCAATALGLTSQKLESTKWEEAILWMQLEHSRSMPQMGVEPLVERRLQHIHAHN